MNEEIGGICGLRSCRAWWSRHKSLFDDHDHMIPCAATPGISQIFEKELLAGRIKLVVFGFVFLLKWWKETASLFKISGGRAEQGAMMWHHRFCREQRSDEPFTLRPDQKQGWTSSCSLTFRSMRAMWSCLHDCLKNNNNLVAVEPDYLRSM